VIITVCPGNQAAERNGPASAAESFQPSRYVLACLRRHLLDNHHITCCARATRGRPRYVGEFAPLFWLLASCRSRPGDGRNPSAAGPTALYGFVLLMCGSLHAAAECAASGKRSRSAFTKASQGDLKGKMSLAFYVCAIGLRSFRPILSDVLYVVVAITCSSGPPV